MALQDTLEKINKRLEALATKEDISDIKLEMKNITDSFMEKLGQLEGRVFDIEAKVEKKDSDLAHAVRRSEELKNSLKSQETRMKTMEREMNDIQQYSRRWHLRVYRVPEAEKEQPEDCVKKLCHIFSQEVGVTITPVDIEVAHRVGQRSSQKARPILVRFFDRKKRDEVIANRKKLKNKGTVIGEDLTYENYKLSTSAHKHSATMSVWSVYGKVFAKLKNGVTLKLNIHMDLDEAFRRAMTSAHVMSDGE